MSHQLFECGEAVDQLLLEDLESLGLAVQVGLGVAVLPMQFASGLEGVVEVKAAAGGAAGDPVLEPRALWMVVHRHKRDVPKVRAVTRWLEEVLAADAAA